MAIQRLARLADIHHLHGRLPEAASAYYKVIVDYEKEEGDFVEPILTTALSLTKVLKTQKKYRDAEILLLYVFGFCLRKSRSHDPQPWTPDSVISLHMINILTSLDEIYAGPLDESSLEIRVGLGDLLTALRLLSGCRLNSHFPHAWFAITRLAYAYSAKGDLSSAHLLFSHSIPVLEGLDDILYGTKKTNAFLGCSLNLRRQRDWEKSARMLMLALENVTQMGDQGMTPREDYEPLMRLVYSSWNELLEELKDQNVDENLVKPMKDLIESKRPQLDHQQQSLEFAVNEMSSLEIIRGRSLRRFPNAH